MIKQASQVYNIRTNRSIPIRLYAIQLLYYDRYEKRAKPWPLAFWYRRQWFNIHCKSSPLSLITIALSAYNSIPSLSFSTFMPKPNCFTLRIHSSVYKLKSRGDKIHSYLTPLLLRNRLISISPSLNFALVLTNLLLTIPTNFSLIQKIILSTF